MDLEYLLAILFVRHGDLYNLIKPSRSENRRIKYVQTVCRSEYQDPFQLINSVEFHQKLAEDPFGNMRISAACTTCRNQRVYFVEEDDAWRSLPGLAENLPD